MGGGNDFLSLLVAVALLCVSTDATAPPSCRETYEIASCGGCSFMLDDISRRLTRQCPAAATLDTCTTLSLRDWHIWDIEEGIFAGLVNLQTLDLGLNQIKELRVNEFADLQSLTTLHLDHNQLSSLNNAVFTPIAGLRNLYLDNNFFSSFDPAVLAPFTSLRTLHLHKNFLSEGETYASVRGILDTVPDITNFNLARNGFDCIETSFPITTTDITQCGILITTCNAQCRFLRVANTDSRPNKNQLIRQGDCSDQILQGCTVLRVGNSGITSLQAGVLYGLQELLELHMEDNSLATLPTDAFRDLDKLKRLYLSGNQMTSLSKSLIAPLFVLEDLELQNNRITALTNNLFDGSPELARLILTGNRLTQNGLPSNSFQGIVFLQALHLQQNRIASLPADILAGLDTLQDLHLEGNQLTTSGLPAGLLVDTVNLEELWLNDNNIATLPDGFLSTVPILKRLGLSGNPLTSLRANLLSTARVVTDLYIADTNLNGFPDGLFSGLANLNRIELQNNNLGTLRNDTFVGNVRLRTVFLSNNNIDSWPDGLFAPMGNLLAEVRVAGNPIGCFPDIASYNGPEDAQLCFDPIVTCSGCTFSLDFTAQALIRSGTCPAAACTSLGLASRNIKRLSAGVLHGMTGLTSLNLRSNVIDELDADAFRDLSALQFLYLNGNQLASLPANVFASLTSLRELELVGNVLSSLRVDSFRFQNALTKLLLTDNRLAQNDLSQSLFLNISTAAAVTITGQVGAPAVTCIPATLEHTGSLNPPACDKVVATCGACRLLLHHDTKHVYREKVCSPADIANGACTEIKVESQGVKTLASGLFDGFTTTRSLSLKSNALTSIDPALFTALTALQSLDLSGNQLTEIPAGAIASPHMDALTTLRLANNQLSTLLAETYDVPALTSLTLSGNDADFKCAETLDSWTGTVDLTRCEQQLATCGNFCMVRSRFTGVLSRTAGECTPGDQDACRNKALNLARSFLRSLTPGVFAGFTELVTLDLSNNFISSLPDGIFVDMTNVGKAYFNGNQISTVNQQTFLGFSKVTTLQFGSNLLTTIRSNTFLSMPAAVQIQIQNNRISSFEACAFCGLDRATELFLQGNRITNLGSSVLTPLVNLEILRLRDNGMTTIHPEAFRGLPKLADVELFFNSIQSLPEGVFLGLPLTRLFIDNNPLLELASGIFQGLSLLQYLRFGDSDIEELPSGLFAGLTALEELFFENAKVRTLPAGIFDDLTSLKQFVAFDNVLTSLPAGVFNNNVNLERVQLQNNELTTLPAGVFANTRKLFLLNLQANKLAALPDRMFSNTVALAELDLDNNLLTTLPLNAFENTTALSVATMKGNQFLPYCAPIPSRYGFSYRVNCARPPGKCSNIKLCPDVFNPCGTCEFHADFFTGDLFFEAGSCVPTDCINLNLRNRAIASFDPNVLDAFVNVETIDLGVNKLDETDLAELRLALKPNLKVLRLDNNQIGAIPETTFSDSWNLETLDLSSNLIPRIEIEHLFCTKSLTHLHLSHNQISALPEGVFNRTFLLETLEVDHNRLTVAPQIAFDYVHWHLRIYDFQFNRIGTVPAPTWSGLCALQEVRINDNRILDLSPASMTQELKEVVLFDVRNNLLAFFLEGHRDNMRQASILNAILLAGNPFGPIPPTLTVQGFDVSNSSATPPLYSGLAIVTIQQAGAVEYAYTSTRGTVATAPVCAALRSATTQLILITTTTVSAFSCDSQGFGRRDTEVVYVDESYHITRTTDQIARVISIPDERTVLVGLARYFSIENYQVLVSSRTVRRFGERGVGDDEAMVVVHDDADASSDAQGHEGGDATAASAVLHENTGRRLLDDTVTVRFIASTPTEYQRILAMLRALAVGGADEQQGFTILVRNLLGIVDPVPPTTAAPAPPSGGGGGGGGIFIPPPPETTSPPIIIVPPTTAAPREIVPPQQDELTEDEGWSRNTIIALSVGIASLLVLLAGCLLWQHSRRNQREAAPKPYGMTRDQGKFQQYNQYYNSPPPNAYNAYGHNPYAYLASPASPQYSLPAHPFDQSGLYASAAPQMPLMYPEGSTMDRSLYQTQQSIPPPAAGEYNAFSPFTSPQKSIMSTPASPAMPNPYQSPGVYPSPGQFQSPTRADLAYGQAY